ncbi:ABC transporter substrate-binding protein [Bradyrhizobium sp. AZCC 2289]|uniref:ABC transporter substrate-binding protein n=1 Tax=Bradyrhizobium sp. AZCC 2289 TaxID=3117026 RepID=UPI002FF18893
MNIELFAALVLSTLSIAGSAFAAETIKIGVIAERSGDYQAVGIPNYNGSRLAIKKINDAVGVTVNGKKYELELVVADSRTDERQASLATVDLVTDKHVKFMFGAIGRLAPIVLQLTEPNKVIYFTSSSSAAPQIDKSKFLILTLPSAQVRATLTARGLATLFPQAKRVAMLLPQEVTTAEMQELIKKAFEGQNLQIVASETFPQGASDLSAPLTRIRSAKPDILFIGWGPDQLAPIVRTNKEVDAAPAFFSYATPCTSVQKVGLDRPYGANTVVGANLDSPATPAAAELAKEYREFIGEASPSNIYAVMVNYDFYFLLAKAIEKAGSIDDTDAILKAMHEISYDGVELKLDAANRSEYGLDFCQVEGADDQVKTFDLNP